MINDLKVANSDEEVLNRYTFIQKDEKEIFTKVSLQSLYERPDIVRILPSDTPTENMYLL